MPSTLCRPLTLLRSGALVALCSCAVAFADDASHRRAAADVLDVVNTPVALRSAILSAVDPLLEHLRSEGAPEAAIQDIKVAMVDWADREIVWDEIKPALVEVYVREFTEDELKTLLAFYRTPAGHKALGRFPVIFAEGARIGQAYAESKQAALTARLEAIAAKYNAKPKTAALPARTTTPQ